METLSVLRTALRRRFFSTFSTASMPLRLNNIRDNPGARKKEVRLGRGRGSGCGKTSGRGQKGQRARNSVRLGFEGGQTPLQKRLPKRNTFNPFAKRYAPVYLHRVQRLLDIGRLDPSRPIGLAELVQSGCVTHPRDGIRLLGDGLATKISIEATEVDHAAARCVIRAGGSVSTVWYNRLGIKRCIRPKWWYKRGLPLPKFASPPPKLRHRYPESNNDGVPARHLKSFSDIEKMIAEWPRPIGVRGSKFTI